MVVVCVHCSCCRGSCCCFCCGCCSCRCCCCCCCRLCCAGGSVSAYASILLVVVLLLLLLRSASLWFPFKSKQKMSIFVLILLLLLLLLQLLEFGVLWICWGPSPVRLAHQDQLVVFMALAKGRSRLRLGKFTPCLHLHIASQLDCSGSCFASFANPSGPQRLFGSRSNLEPRCGLCPNSTGCCER